MAEVESVMQRLAEETRRLRAEVEASQPETDPERALTLGSLALVSEAVLRIGRDVRQIRLQLAERN